MKVGIGLTIALVLAIAFGTPLHALIPHEHGHAYSHAHEHEERDTEDAVWKTLHSALRHEDKKIVIALPAIDAIDVLTELVFLARAYFSRFSKTDSLMSALSRGVLSYRRFG